MATTLASRTPLIMAWLLGLLLVPCAQAQAQTTAPKPSSETSTSTIGNPAYSINTLWTTRFGPAYADILLVPSRGAQSPNMLSCKPSTNQGFAYALCYYSGPPVATGTAGNPALPCELSSDNRFARCVCYKITNTDFSNDYQVDINAILNLNVYRKTIAACNHDGTACSSKGATIIPPVCDAINDATKAPSPKIVSVFSMAMNGAYSSSPSPGSTPCRAGLYAGCMTGECTDHKQSRNGHAVVDCQCPVFNGPYQVGEDNAQCNANLVSKSEAGTTKGAGPFYVWSAARTVIVNTTPPAKTVSKP